MESKTSKKINSIKDFLKEGPLSISEIAKKADIDWRTAEQYLYLLKKLDLIEEIQNKHTRRFFLKDPNNYFKLPVKKEHEKKISTIYYNIKKFCSKKFGQDPTKTQAYKIIWKINQKLKLGLPIGWYKFGPCCVQVYQSNEEREYGFESKAVSLIRETTLKYCACDNFKLQNIIYAEAGKKLYQIKERLVMGTFENKEDINPLLMDLIKLASRETIDVVTDFARTVLLINDWNITKTLFNSVWKYITLIEFRNTLKDYYGEERLKIYLKEQIEEARKEAQLEINDFVKCHVESKYSQDKRYQSWKKTRQSRLGSG